MKKSEMIALITQFLKDQYGPVIEPDIGDITACVSVALLDLIEDEGMRPPLWNNFNPTQSERTFSSDADWTYHGEEKGYSLECDYWEDES